MSALPHKRTIQFLGGLGYDRRIGDQIVRTMFARGITPCERGDRRGVLHTKTAPRLERKRSLGSCALPREADGRVTVGAVRKGSVERVELVAELRERVQGLNDRTLEVLVDFRGGLVVTVDVTAVVGLAQQLHVVLAGKRADIVDLRNARQDKLHTVI